MNIIKQRNNFDMYGKIYNSVIVKFLGVDGYDVYNTSIPFSFEGKTYIYGRIEKREEWARSHVLLFEQVGDDTFSLVRDAIMYNAEDPFITFIGGRLVLGHNYVRRSFAGNISNVFVTFWSGVSPFALYSFASGPDNMKDIRLLELKSGKIGVFSRPRGEHIKREHGSESLIGYCEINSLDELSSTMVESAKNIPGIFESGQWGGVNEAHELLDGSIGVIGHKSFWQDGRQVYIAVSFVFDPVSYGIFDMKIIATRNSLPAGPQKLARVRDVLFPSGILKRSNGLCDLYSGVSDCETGRITIDDPFSSRGGLVK